MVSAEGVDGVWIPRAEKSCGWGIGGVRNSPEHSHEGQYGTYEHLERSVDLTFGARGQQAGCWSDKTFEPNTEELGYRSFFRVKVRPTRLREVGMYMLGRDIRDHVKLLSRKHGKRLTRRHLWPSRRSGKANGER